MADEDRMSLTRNAKTPAGTGLIISTSNEASIGGSKSTGFHQVWANMNIVKPLEAFKSESNSHAFNRHLRAKDLILIGIGGTIGTGIFVLTGLAAAKYAGPGVAISYCIAGLVAGLSALCYSEMAAMIPVSGSCYSYAYATMGELTGWIIGWDLILEYLVGAATVAVGWSGYVCSFIHDAFGLEVGRALTQPPIGFDTGSNHVFLSGDLINLPAVIVVLMITAVLVLGIKESALLNAVAVSIKLTVIGLFVVTSLAYINPDNWKPFVPPNTGKYGEFGFSGILQASSLVFFSYIGFDAVSTTAQECENPQRDLPIGILASLIICTVIYILVSVCLTGVAHYSTLNVPHPIAIALDATGLKWMAAIVEFGAIAGLSSVLLVQLMGQPRIFYSMARDGLLPESFAELHPRYKTPWRTTLMTGVICAALAGLFPIEVLGELTSIGTLFAFFLVNVGVAVMRIKKPDLPRKFMVPGGPYLIPGLGATLTLVLIFGSNPYTILRLVIWMLIGMVVYWRYGYKHSRLRRASSIPIDRSTELLPEAAESKQSDDDVVDMVPFEVRNASYTAAFNGDRSPVHRQRNDDYL